MKEEPKTTLSPEDLKGLSNEVVNIFLGLSLVLEECVRTITCREATDKHKIYFTPLDISLGPASADPIKDSRARTYSLCIHILRTITSLQCEKTSPLHEYSNVFSPKLQSFITKHDFDDHHPIVRDVFKEFTIFYTAVQPPNMNMYWRIKNHHKYRASIVLSQRKDWTIALAKQLFLMHSMYKDRSLKLGMGLVSVYSLV